MAILMETTYLFAAGTSEVFSIDLAKLPPGTLFQDIVDLIKDSVDIFNNSEIIMLPEIEARSMNIVGKLITKGIIPTIEELDVLSFFRIDESYSYPLSLIREDHMRNNMYREEFILHEMNVNPHYGLSAINPEILHICDMRHANMLFISEHSLQLQSMKEIHLHLEKFKFLFQMTNVVGVLIAGGSILNALLNTQHSDIDIFLYKRNQDEAIKQIVKLIRSHHGSMINIDISRTNNVVNIYVNKLSKNSCQYQIILRLYSTPSEILHGFDCCSVGYDGNPLWEPPYGKPLMGNPLWENPRALFAITHGYNTVNFDRLSPSYGDRLIKYGIRGLGIDIPNFNRNKIEPYLDTGITAIELYRSRHILLKNIN